MSIYSGWQKSTLRQPELLNLWLLQDTLELSVLTDVCSTVIGLMREMFEGSFENIDFDVVWKTACKKDGSLNMEQLLQDLNVMYAE